MLTVFETQRFSYGLSDEVVLRLRQEVPVLDVARAAPVPPAWLPSWTIGVVIGRVLRAGAHAYAVRFQHHDAPCVAVVDERDIEGLA